jgi:hypothetical protein
MFIRFDRTATRNISSCDGTRVLNLRFIGCRDCPSKPPNDGGRDSADRNTVIVQSFSDMPERYKKNMIGGALFLAGIGIFAAYLPMRGNKEKKNHQNGD